MRPILFIITFILITKSIFAQNIIYGNVTEKASKAILPQANIYIKGTYIGTVSNNEGKYSLEILNIPATIVFSYIGYETRNIVIDRQGKHNLNIRLQPIILELESIAVLASKEDPAIEIMKKVIINKSKWRKKLKSFKTKAYTRTKVENDSSIVSISESVSRLYWDIEKDAREEFIYKNSSRQMSYLTDMNVGSKNIINFNNDNISITNHNFMGPTHPDAMDYYNFELIGERAFNNKIVFDIKLNPISKLQPLFTGKISVLDEEFAMIEADLSIAEYINFNEMIESFQARYIQHFSNFGKEFWLPVDSRTEERIKINMGLLVFPNAILKKISRISNYEINIDVSKEITRLDSVNNIANKDAMLLNNHEVFADFEKVPFNENEYKVFNKPDTTLTLAKSFPPTGILSSWFLAQEAEMEAALRKRSNYNVIQSDSDIGYQFWYNRVEGFNLGVSFNYIFKNSYQVFLKAGYQTYAQKFYYDTESRYFFDNTDTNKYFYMSYYDKTDTRYSSENYSQLFTSLLPLFGNHDYFDYYSNSKLATGFKYGIKNLTSEFTIELSSANHRSINKKYSCRFLNHNYSQRINPKIDEGKMSSVKLSYTYDELYNYPEFVKMAGLDWSDKIQLQIEHSSSSFLNSSFDFTLYRAILDYKWDTFFQRRPDCNYLRTRVEASTFSGDLPLQRFSIIDGRIYSYSLFGNFKTIVNKPLEGQKKIAFFWEYNFRSIPFEIVGLEYLSNNKYELLIHGASGRTWIDGNKLTQIQKNYNPNYLNDYQHELGIAIKFKYRFIALRIDATRNLSNHRNYLGFSFNLLSLSF